MALLEVENLNICYGKVRSIVDISFKIKQGECVSFVGPNGAGKSTLLNAISGLVDWQGRITFDGLDISQLNPSEIVRRGIVQCPERKHIFPFMTVKDNLLLGAYTKRDTVKENLELTFKLFPILKERQNQLAGTLSGGEAQMLTVGRSLLSNPRLLMLDEPMFGIAPKLREDFSKVLEILRKKRKLTLLIAEQEISITIKHSDKMHLIRGGKIIKTGTPNEFKRSIDFRGYYLGI